MASALTAKVLSNRHRYRDVKVDQAAALGKSRPPDDAFTPDKSKTTMEFHKLVSTSQCTDHYSPGSENWSVRIADLACLRDARARNDFQIISRVWLGSFFAPVTTSYGGRAPLTVGISQSHTSKTVQL